VRPVLRKVVAAAWLPDLPGDVVKRNPCHRDLRSDRTTHHVTSAGASRRCSPGTRRRDRHRRRQRRRAPRPNDRTSQPPHQVAADDPRPRRYLRHLAELHAGWAVRLRYRWHQRRVRVERPHRAARAQRQDSDRRNRLLGFAFA
jgi:hypothetical protein